MAEPRASNFETCWKRVHDDAFEAILAVHMVTPLRDRDPSSFPNEDVQQTALFLRRSLTRYLALVLHRMLDKPNQRGHTGVTVSISSLLEMAGNDGILGAIQLQELKDEFERVKARAQANGNLIEALWDLRTIHVAHSLIPHEEPEEQLWADELLSFARDLFAFVVALEADLSHATGKTLPDLEQNAGAFGVHSSQFWSALGNLPGS
jgi:hypothetical protein